MSTSLFKRNVVDEITKYLHSDDIVVIHGARQVGKTSILMYLQEGPPRNPCTKRFSMNQPRDEL